VSSVADKKRPRFVNLIRSLSPYSHTYYYWYSITHLLFHSRLKSFLFCKSSLPQPFHFLLQDSLYRFPRLFTVTSEHIRIFEFLVFFCFYTFLVVGSVRRIKLTYVGFRAHVKIASRIVSYRIVYLSVSCRNFSFQYSTIFPITPCQKYRTDRKNAQTERQTDRQTRNCCYMCHVMDANSVIKLSFSSSKKFDRTTLAVCIISQAWPRICYAHISSAISFFCTACVFCDKIISR